eukprot:3911087-Amphidinium_carterae.1
MPNASICEHVFLANSQTCIAGGSIPSRSDAVWSRGPYFYWQYDNSAESLDAIEGACRRSAALGPAWSSHCLLYTSHAADDTPCVDL